MKPRVLIVDDDDGIRFTLRSILSRADLQVTDVASAEAALEAMEREEPNLVITDLRMPGMDGLELLRSIKERPSPPRVSSPRHAMTNWLARSASNRKACPPPRAFCRL